MYKSNMISSIYNDPDQNIDLEFYLTGTVAPFAVSELLLRARYLYTYCKSLMEDNDSPQSEIDNLTYDIIGTNDDDRVTTIESMLIDLKADYEIKKNHVFFEYSIDVEQTPGKGDYVSKTQQISCKYMFVLKSTKDVIGNCAIKYRNGSIADGYKDFEYVKKVYMEEKDKDYINSCLIPYYFYKHNSNEFTIKNDHYPIEPEEDYFHDSPAHKASAVVLEVIARSFNDEFYEQVESDYKNRRLAISNNKTQSTTQTSNKPEGQVPIKKIIIICIAALIFAGLIS